VVDDTQEQFSGKTRSCESSETHEGASNTKEGVQNGHHDGYDFASDQTLASVMIPTLVDFATELLTGVVEREERIETNVNRSRVLSDATSLHQQLGILDTLVVHDHDGHHEKESRRQLIQSPDGSKGKARSQVDSQFPFPTILHLPITLVIHPNDSLISRIELALCSKRGNRFAVSEGLFAHRIRLLVFFH